MDIDKFIKKPTVQEIIWILGFFLVVLISAKFGHHIFNIWKTFPAVLWPPTGIILACIYLRGYRYAVPAFLGLFIAAAISVTPESNILLALIFTPLAQVSGGILGVYILHRVGFEGNFSKVMNVVKFFAVIIFSCMVAPTVTVALAAYFGQLSSPYYISWSHLWSGYAFSNAIMAPLIITWAKRERDLYNRSYFEALFAGAIVLLSTYLLFWTHGNSPSAFFLFSFFFVAQFWVSFRFSSRVVMLTAFATTVIGMLGLFFSPSLGYPLKTQLLSGELFLLMVEPIFYLFSALVKERADTIYELQRALKRIEMESEVQFNFISVLAHELRNPLAPVKTVLEIIQEKELDPQTREIIKSAHHQLHTMRRLLDDLLDLTRVTQGKFQLQIERSHLCTLLERSVALTKSLFKDRVLILPPVCDDSIWLDVDPTRFEQALVNILNNAAKYSPPGGTIETHSVIKGDELEIRISDTGIGIAEEDLENIFKPFWQLKKSNASSGSGIGVGLSLTKHIVELHGGTIRAESKGIGKGSVFIITMPVIISNMYQETSEKLSPLPIARRKILIVDDNQAAADSLSQLLAIRGHEVQTAYTGFDAVEHAKNFGPELILLDLGLPDLSGYEVARTLRAGGFKKQIVALSGYGQKEDKERSMKAGCDAHMVKPISIAQFEAYLNTLSQQAG